MSDFYPNYDLANRISGTKLATGFGGLTSARIDPIKDPVTGNFQNVLSGMVQKLNNEINEPDELLKDLMSGNKNVDIHDVMIAMSKSEINVTVATTAVGKVIQAYDKVMQIQV